MRIRRVLCAVVTVSVCLAAAAVAQPAPGTVAQVIMVKPQGLDWSKLEPAMKAHYAWHGEQHDTFPYFVWQVVSGEDIGAFVVGTFGHEWKDFDGYAEFEQKDVADFLARVAPVVGDLELSYWSYLPKLSRPRAEMTPAAMAHVTHYLVEPDGFTEFLGALTEMQAALEKSTYTGHLYWYRLISGGESPQFVLSVALDSWADMAPEGKSLEEELAEVVGVTKAAALLDTIRDTTRSTRSYTIAYRPDMSYIPTKK